MSGIEVSKYKTTYVHDDAIRAGVDTGVLNVYSNGTPSVVIAQYAADQWTSWRLIPENDEPPLVNFDLDRIQVGYNNDDDGIHLVMEDGTDITTTLFTPTLLDLLDIASDYENS